MSTTIGFQWAMVEHRDFIEGRVHTRWIEERLADAVPSQVECRKRGLAWPHCRRLWIMTMNDMRTLTSEPVNTIDGRVAEELVGEAWAQRPPR